MKCLRFQPQVKCIYTLKHDKNRKEEPGEEGRTSKQRRKKKEGGTVYFAIYTPT